MIKDHTCPGVSYKATEKEHLSQAAEGKRCIPASLATTVCLAGCRLPDIYQKTTP